MDIDCVVSSASSDIQSSGHALTSAQVENMPLGTGTYKLATEKVITSRILSQCILDLEACQPISLSPEGATAVVKAFMQTEAYCP